LLETTTTTVITQANLEKSSSYNVCRKPQQPGHPELPKISPEIFRTVETTTAKPRALQGVSIDATGNNNNKKEDQEVDSPNVLPLALETANLAAGIEPQWPSPRSPHC